MNQVKGEIYYTTIKAEGDDIKGFFGKAADNLEESLDLERYSDKDKKHWNNILGRLREASETGKAEDVHLQYIGGYALATTQNRIVELKLYLWSEACDGRLLTDRIEKSLKESGFSWEYIMEEEKKE